MKKKKVESVALVPPKGQGKRITVQLVDDILVLNICIDKSLKARHCINTKTHEYATLDGTVWHETNIWTAMDCEESWGYVTEKHKTFAMAEKDKKVIRETMQAREYEKDIIRIIWRREEEYSRDRRERAQMNRERREDALMERVPPIPQEARDWIDQKMSRGQDWCIKTPDGYLCTACGKTSQLKEYKGRIHRNHEETACPSCGHRLIIEKRKKEILKRDHMTLIQPINKDHSVMRHFDAVFYAGPPTLVGRAYNWEINTYGKTRGVFLFEQMRTVINRPSARKEGLPFTLFYNQDARIWQTDGSGTFRSKNPANHRTAIGYLYDGGIEEALKGTAYEPWTRFLEQASRARVKINSNRLASTLGSTELITLCELLMKGRFYSLLRSVSEEVTYGSMREGRYYPGGYYGTLNERGSSIQEVFGISDRQKINRIRDRDGGTRMLGWMRWSDETGKKISDKALTWLETKEICVKDFREVLGVMSLEQAVNYIERQCRESYKGWNAGQVISQYKDYLGMCRKLGKDLSDALVYRPRDLRRRHGEAVTAVAERDAEIRAEEYSARYREAEDVLQRIRGKYEFQGEEFFIRVPQRIVEIVKEGQALHHCAGSTDRYFDRIKQEETYICFLRKSEEPETPFYTIEVEPGGTIRQHRGMFDEEPELDKVKPFLRQWQAEIRRRMSREDHRLAAASKEKREANIEELKANNNTRVLQGLLEDFMEAI